MLNPNTVTSLASVFMIALVIRGLMPFRHRETSLELVYFSKGLSWVLAIFMMRTVYWGVARGAVDQEAWSRWNEFVGGPFYINAIFNAGLIIGCWYVLKAFHAMIPEADRDAWHVISSPFYPKGWCFARITRLMRRNYK